MSGECTIPAWVDRDMVSRLEDLTLTDWPSLQTVHDNGWLIRLSGGHTGRSNCVIAQGSGDLDGRDGSAGTTDRIHLAEQVYAAGGLPTVFRLTPLSPPALEQALQARGYRLKDESIVMIADNLPAALPAEPADLLLSHRLEEEWCAAYIRIRQVPAAEQGPMRAILAAIPMPTLYGAVVQDGRLTSLALAILDRGWAGLYKVATAANSQRQGQAGRLLTALLAQAPARGAGRAYLQVGAGNDAGIRLYRRLGFRPAYMYRYWTRPAG
jgi:N-acetylglutamate synthase